MTIRKERRPIWLIVSIVLWGLAGLVLLFPMVYLSIFLFDAPGTSNNPLVWVLFFCMVSFPVLCILSSLGTFILQFKFKRLAYPVSILPLAALVFLVTIGFLTSLNGPKDTTMQAKSNAAKTVKCALKVLDSADGFNTKGCGMLEIGAAFTGTIRSTTEAHQWQFASQGRVRMALVVENGKYSCPQISILDLDGRVVESFEKENYRPTCLTGMITTAFFYFNPPGDGTYTLQVITPEKQGAYWVRIE